jgi:transmembrane sensor
MMSRDFELELRQEEALRQAEGIPPNVRRSIRARVERTVSAGTERADGNRGWFRTVGLAVAVTVVAAGLSLVILRDSTHLASFELARKSADLAARVNSGLVEIDRGKATLFDAASGVTLETTSPAALRREASGVRVVRGRMKVRVLRRVPGSPPATIYVSHGAIEVMGTAFTVTQGVSDGSVALHEGSIRFLSAGHAPVTLRPGEALSWPFPLAPETAPAAPSTAAPVPAPVPAPSGAPLASPSSSALPAPRPSASARSSEELLNYVEELRSRHQFEAAARELSRGLASQPASARERLSFELGSLLSHQIRDPRRACAHWVRHERQFHGGVYRDQVEAARRALDCSAVSAKP